MHKMLCPEPDSFSQSGLDFARKITDLTAVKLTQSEFNQHASKYDAVLIRFNTKVSSDLLNKKSNIKAIISPTTGLDHIDLTAAKNNGVRVFHLYGEKNFLKTISGTAELTIGLMISILRKIPQSFDSVKEGIWDAGLFRGSELSGKTLGIIGCGRLGTKVSRAAIALGMKVVSYDPFISRFPAGVISKTSQLEVFLEADIVSLHVPLLPETIHLIGEDEINQMKNGVVIINTSRGAIIKSQSLISGLKKGKVSSAAVDVIENEHLSLGEAHPFIEYAKNYDNLIITPHIGGATFESVENTDLFILRKYEEELRKNHE
jgi:D-3-phosphoglycerate dehydrogenase / 2-oxoglutarate reductase